MRSSTGGLLVAATWLFVTALIIALSQQQQKWKNLNQTIPEITNSIQQTKDSFELRRRRLSSSDSKPDDAAATPPIQQPARFLMGIFTIAKERERRDLIRNALAMYQDRRICFLGSRDGNLPPAPADHCELIYTFVFGANPKGPTQVLGNESGPVITTPPSGFEASVEPNDITFLNIKENMEDGKSPTWFHYASQLMNAYNLDYTIKCDSDTFVRVDRFFDVSQEYLPRQATKRYAGKMTWSFLRNHTYMEGQFYVLSKDLAETVATMSVQHISGVVNIEDSDTGYFIMNRHRMVHLIVLRDRFGRMPWKHPLKREYEFKDMLKKESRRLFGNESVY